MHGPRCFLQELPGHVHFCTGGYGEDSSRLRNFEGFKLVTNLKETKEAKCKAAFKLYLCCVTLKSHSSHSTHNINGSSCGTCIYVVMPMV